MDVLEESTKNSEHRKFIFMVFPVYMYFSDKDGGFFFSVFVFLRVSGQLTWSQKLLRYILRTCINSKG